MNENTQIVKEKRSSNYIVDVAMWPNFGLFIIFYERSCHNWNFIRIFLMGGLGSSSLIWDWF